MDGTLLRVLKRMRGLQSVDIKLANHSGYLIPDPALGEQFICDEEDAQDFMLLIKEELSHIKKITLAGSVGGSIFEDPATINWITHELKKRNEAWAPPSPT